MLNPDSILNSAASDREAFDRAAHDIARVGRFLAEQGWSPATSSNYSVRLSDKLLAITRSGINKFMISPSDIMVIDHLGETVATPLDSKTPVKSSAETLIHTAIYKVRKSAHAILHTHSASSTRLSLKFLNQGSIEFQGYEMQKGLTGQTSHESTVVVPILPNSQDMKSFSLLVERLLIQYPQIVGFLIAGHGLYTWGADLATTQRHIETFEFLFECKALELSGV